MKICINGNVLLAHPREFCRLADSVINNSDEIFILSVVHQKQAEEIFNKINSLFCPNTCFTVISFVGDGNVSELTLQYVRDYSINLYITNNLDEARYINRNSNIVVLTH